MEDYTEVVTDAISVPNNKYIIHKNKNYELLRSMLDHFSIDDYRSLLFLLIDRLPDIDVFFNYINKDTTFLKNIVLEMKLDDEILIELFGTLKMYKELRSLETCARLFKMKYQDFNKIDKLWKFLFALCEEISDTEIWVLRNSEKIPEKIQNRILSAEEYFAYCFQHGIIKKDDVSHLKGIFKKNSKCLDIIDAYENPQLQKYHIKDPSSISSCGIALIFNFESFVVPDFTKREGSAIDVVALQEMWQAFGFETFVENDLSKSKVLEKLKDFALKDHSEYDAFVCCVLSHGDADLIYASDGKKIHIATLIEVICNECQTLKDKPKLYFIQACQGTKVLEGDGMIKYETNCLPTPEPYIKLKMNPVDVYAVVSTINGFVSFRCPQKGSLFVRSLCQVMLKHGHKDSITDVITNVTAQVLETKITLPENENSKPIQIVPAYSTLRKRLILKKIT